jgi:DnaJ-domain-containing protein 1
MSPLPFSPISCVKLLSASVRVVAVAGHAGVQDGIRRANLELKKASRKDYYKVLGVPKDADQKAIKKAFRKLALENHP